MSTKTLNQRDKYLFDISNYKIVTEIKRGGFGVVNLVEDQKTGSKYAAKTNLIQNTKQNKLFISREVRILIQVQHPTIIQFRGFSYVDFEDKKNITILMDYMKNGSLADLIAKEEKGLCPDEYNNTKRQIILIGIVRGMMLLHKLHIIHRDLKPENILIDDDFHPHITDFGLSKFFDPNHSASQSMADVGTAAYMAPEVINTERFNTKADVYSFGILMFELLSAKRAYKSLLKGKKKIPIFQFKRKVCEGLRPEIEKGSMKKSHQIMIEKCLSENPKDRPTFSELYKKLSLSNEDDFLDFSNQTEPNVIDYAEEEAENDDDDDEMGIDKTFCLDSVDYDEVLCYVDDISEEPTRYDQLFSNGKEKAMKSEKQEEIQMLEREVGNLKKLLKKSNDEIESVKKDHEKQVEQMNKKMEREVGSLKTLLKKSNDEIESLKKDHENQVEQMSKKMAGELEGLKKKYDAEIDKLTKEINQLKENQTKHVQRQSLTDLKPANKLAKEQEKPVKKSQPKKNHEDNRSGVGHEKDQSKESRIPASTEVKEQVKPAEESKPEIKQVIQSKENVSHSTLDLICAGVKLKKVQTKEPRLPTLSEIEEQKKLLAEEKKQNINQEPQSKKEVNRSSLDLVSDGVKPKKAQAKESRIPASTEIKEQAKTAEESKPEIKQVIQSKGNAQYSMLDLICAGVKLKKVQTKEPRLPTLSEIEEQKKLLAEEKKQNINQELQSKKEVNRSSLDLVSDGVKPKKAQTKDPRIPASTEVKGQTKPAKESKPEIKQVIQSKGNAQNSMLDLICAGVKLKKVQTKEPRLPTLSEIEEQKRLLAEEKNKK